ncbi:unnamed protein product [Paramecium primaurelia]|uniref:Uncharacterized protein n=1 Tax=Paramecium primaurelia TaxID=5886 RepID=A0A8S1LT86_PARPR|nr:unnamed protein product [Paramecium primaurelia]
MLTLEQQGSKIQCPKYEHDKKPIIQICMNPKCKENSLICLKCKSQHDQHPNFIFTLLQIQDFLQRNIQINKSINNPLTQEILDHFLKYKQELMNRLNDIEKQLKDSIALLNENNSIKEIYNQCVNLKTQLNYETFKKIIDKLHDNCTYDLNLQKLQSNELLQKYDTAKPQMIMAINTLQKLVQSMQQTFEIKKETTNNKQSQNKLIQIIKRYEQVAKDSDGTLTIKPLKNNKMFVCNFLVEQTCELLGFYQPFLYKNKDIDYQSQQLKCLYKIHLGYDLAIRAYEFQTVINHNQLEKPIPYCYYIKLPEQFRLISGQVFTISLTILDIQSYSVSFQKLTDNNQYLKFQFPKFNQYSLPKEIKEIDDYGYFPCFQLI